MSELVFSPIDGFTVALGKEIKPSAETLKGLVALMASQHKFQDKPLGGRNCISVGEIAGIGRVVVRKYTRGGYLRHLIQERYFRFGSTRGEREYRMLDDARAIGINVPDPVGFAWRGGFWYEAWLFTREIPGTKSVAECAVENDERISSIMDQVLAQVVALIRHRIFHVDLHPGNVLIDATGRVYLLDFDKAVHFKGGLHDLRDRYLCRWRRAVIKHELPDILAELMSHGLRINLE
jgi:tRNA A-37 threonylcarbamoyl transferase component Bud32